MSDHLADTMHSVFTPEEFAQFRKDVEFGRKSFITIVAPRQEKDMAGNMKTWAISGEDGGSDAPQWYVLLYAAGKEQAERFLARHFKKIGREDLLEVDSEIAFEIVKPNADNIVFSTVEAE